MISAISSSSLADERLAAVRENGRGSCASSIGAWLPHQYLPLERSVVWACAPRNWVCPTSPPLLGHKGHDARSPLASLPERVPVGADVDALRPACLARRGHRRALPPGHGARRGR